MDTPTPTFDQVAEQLAARVQRLLDERTTSYASATQVIVSGLHDELAAHTEAMNQLSGQLARVGSLLDLTNRRIDVLDAIILGGRLAVAAD